LSFEEFMRLLKTHKLEVEKSVLFEEIKDKFNDKKYNLLHFFGLMRKVKS